MSKYIIQDFKRIFYYVYWKLILQLIFKHYFHASLRSKQFVSCTMPGHKAGSSKKWLGDRQYTYNNNPLSTWCCLWCMGILLMLFLNRIHSFSTLFVLRCKVVFVIVDLPCSFPFPPLSKFFGTYFYNVPWTVTIYVQHGLDYLDVVNEPNK
jgi:hypothetical protein